MQSNFDFLEKDFPILAKIGSTAEKYLYSDPNSCFIKLGMFGETIVNLMLKLDSIAVPEFENTHANRIRLLKKNGLIPRDIDDILYSLRTTRNDAVHQNFEDLEKCKTLLNMAYTLSVWFMETYGNCSFETKPFVIPPQEDVLDYKALSKEREEEILRLYAGIKDIQSQNIDTADREKRGKKAASNINLSEKETRLLIDEQLRMVGWEADTETLRYAKGTRPTKGKNIAIAEWPTNSKLGERGYVDYALFAGIKLVGLVEAKKSLVDVSSIIDVQCKDYAKNIKNEHNDYIISTWHDYKVPFVFATNGRKYLKQLHTKSGIWFLDLRQRENQSKAQQGWPSPQGLTEWLEKDIEQTNQKLKNTSTDILTDKNGLSLRPYQIKAIEATEKAIINGTHSALISMATGTGKTRTVLGMIYRFLKSGRFKRILFLVDRNALGEQAQDVFKDVKIDELMTINNIYTIKNLDDSKEIDPETKIQVATVQSLVKRIIYNAGDKIPAVSDYDLIIVDEAHRGYILDKELGDDELLYRDETDYISKYRAVIDYFDAVKIGLTATPAVHTTDIFGSPIFNYSYREAVIEGYLVDHDAPHHLETHLGNDGINYEKGEVVAIYDPITGEITNSAELEDELKFDLEHFNRKVITPDFNQTVLTEIAEYISPEGPGKTLIYAVSDSHADLIVDKLRKIYEPMGIDQDAIQKITGSIGDKKRVINAIKHFKNEQYPSIVVTVDLLTTGIDVPEITTLVFMRRVKSRILFEQMLGRATRKCDEIGKIKFDIFDPVGVYESLLPVSTMKPVIANPETTFIDLYTGLETLNTEAKIQNQIDMIVAKIRRKQNRMTQQQQDKFEYLSDGKSVGEFMNYIRSLSPIQAKNILIKKREIFELLHEGGIDLLSPVIISDKPDKLISHTRGYGRGQKPDDYLNEFKRYVIENTDKIEALKLVCTRPTELTREALKSLRLKLDMDGFNEIQLNSAWKEAKNQEITADIISFIRSQAIGSELLSHNERIKKAVLKLKQAHQFSKMEEQWLDRIEKFLLTETVLNVETFNLGAFRDSGGFIRIDKIFKNKLKDYIIELNNYLYDDRGQVSL